MSCCIPCPRAMLYINRVLLHIGIKISVQIRYIKKVSILDAEHNFNAQISILVMSAMARDDTDDRDDSLCSACFLSLSLSLSLSFVLSFSSFSSEFPMDFCSTIADHNVTFNALRELYETNTYPHSFQFSKGLS